MTLERIFKETDELFQRWDELPEGSAERKQIEEDLIIDIKLAIVTCCDDTDRILDYAGMGLRVAPKNPAFLMLKADLFHATGRYDDALRMIEQIDPDDPHFGPASRKVAFRIHMLSGEMEEAFEVLTFLIHDDPGNARLWLPEPMRSETNQNICRNLGTILDTLDDLIQREPASVMHSLVKGAFLHTIGLRGLRPDPNYIDYMCRDFKAPQEALSEASAAYSRATSDPCFADQVFGRMGLVEITRGTPENIQSLYNRALRERPDAAQDLQKSFEELKDIAAEYEQEKRKRPRQEQGSLTQLFGEKAQAIFRRAGQLIRSVIPKNPQP